MKYRRNQISANVIADLRTQVIGQANIHKKVIRKAIFPKLHSYILFRRYIGKSSIHLVADIFLNFTDYETSSKLFVLCFDSLN